MSDREKAAEALAEIIRCGRDEEAAWWRDLVWECRRMERGPEFLLDVIDECESAKPAEPADQEPGHDGPPHGGRRDTEA